MTAAQARPALGGIAFMMILIAVGGYFTFAAVQGEYGVFRKAQIRAEAATLTAERDLLAAELAEMQNRSKRLSDEFLDIDLLDQQARDVLGYLRADEIVIR